MSIDVIEKNQKNHKNKTNINQQNNDQFLHKIQ